MKAEQKERTSRFFKSITDRPIGSKEYMNYIRDHYEELLKGPTLMDRMQEMNLEDS